MEYNHINEECLKMNAYQYFKYCQKGPKIRGVAVVTDKQSIFYSQILKDDYKTHDNIMICIENEIHPYDKREGWDAIRQNHAYLASVGKELVINLPDNGELSLNQASLICSILDEVEKINQENENHKIKIDCYGSKENSIFDIYDIEKMKRHIKSCVTQNQILEPEKIIGKTLSELEREKHIKQSLSLSNFANHIELMNRCREYYNDDFYHDLFIKVFPDYEKIKDLIFLCDITFFNGKQEDITFETIITHIKHRFKTFKKANDITEFFGKWEFQQLSEELKQSLFPDYSRFYKIFRHAYIFGKLDVRINTLLEQGISYEDFARELYAMEYNKISMEILKKEENLQNSINRRNEIKRREQAIKSKNQIEAMINKKAEIEAKLSDNFSNELELNMAYHVQTEKNNNQMRRIQELSSSKFKRFINYITIKQEKEKEKAIRQNMTDLEKKVEQNKTTKEELEKAHKELEHTFMELTNLSYFPSDISWLNYYFEQNYEEEKQQLDLYISKIKQDIDRAKKELIEIASSSLLKDSDSINLQNEYRPKRNI